MLEPEAPCTTGPFCGTLGRETGSRFFGQAPCTRSGPGPETSSGDGGPIGDKSSEPRLNLISSWQQGHSADYSTAFEPSRLQGIYPGERVELPCAGPEGPTGYAPGPARSRPIVSRVTVAGMT